MIEFINVSRKSKDRDLYVLKDINLKIAKGEFVYVTGPSGSGKTTLLRMIYREKRPTEGIVTVKGKNIANLSEGRIPYLRRQVGVIFQDFKLLKKRTVYKNIAYALEVVGKSDEEINPRIKSVLKFIGMSDKEEYQVQKLSAGEKQRVAIARAIINSPEILICDEITGNLNYEISQGIMRLLLELNEMGTTILFATHDSKILETYPKRTIRIEKGVIVNDSHN